MGVKIPATGTGDPTPTVATEKIAGSDFQLIKLVDGTPGGSQGVLVDSSGRLSVALAAASALVGASISNFPATQPVTGYLGASLAGGLAGASVANLPAVQPVSGYLGGSLAGGYVGASVPNFPALSGASISNVPQISIASYAVTQPVSLASSGVQVGASISNFPATQPVSGYLGASLAGGYVGASLAGGLAGASVSNFPATQPVSGYLGASLAGGYVGASIPGGYVGASLAGGYVGASLAGAASIAGGNITPVGGSTSATNIGGSVSTQNIGGSSAVMPAAAAVGGASPFQYVAGASVNNVNVKAAAGTLYSMSAMSVASQPRYVKMYDKATTPSVGQDAPIHTFMVPGAASMLGNSWQQTFPVGLKFNVGIGFGISASAPNTDKTALLATDNVLLNLSFA